MFDAAGAVVVVVAAAVAVMVGGAHVPESTRYPPLSFTPRVGTSWLVSVHHGVYDSITGHVTVVVDASVTVVPVTEHAIVKH